jgi:hypothetical protein
MQWPSSSSMKQAKFVGRGYSNCILYFRIENNAEVLTLKIGQYDWKSIFHHTDVIFGNGAWIK